MPGSAFGAIFRFSTWGESHGACVGAVVEGCPAGLALTEADIKRDLDRRKPGTDKFSTGRAEADVPEILSGVYEGLTTGAPISVIVKNSGARAADYDGLKNVFRPGHADYGAQMKYGLRDHRGGGRFSGRETVSRVVAGAIAKKFLRELNVSVRAYTIEINGVRIDKNNFDMAVAGKNPLRMPDGQAFEKASAALNETLSRGDSAGGVVECVISNLPPGTGEPVFDKLDAELAKAVFSVGGVKGVEFGAGFAAARMAGSAHNDAFFKDENGNISKLTNNAGGVTGGMSDGADIIFRAAFKPVPSIKLPQRTVFTDGAETEIKIGGRHDAVIVPRAAVVVECMAAAVIADMILRGLPSKMENIRKVFSC